MKICKIANLSGFCISESLHYKSININYFRYYSIQIYTLFSNTTPHKLFPKYLGVWKR